MKKQKKRGFTLIELIVVIAILVALLLILVPRLTGFTSTAAEVQCQQTRQKVMEMYKAYEIKGEPVSAKDLLANKDDEYFISKPQCSSGGELSAVEIKGLVTLIRCSKHGSTNSGNLDTTPKGIQSAMLEFMNFLLDEKTTNPNIIKDLTGFPTLNNDRLRNFMKNEIYGGSWPSLSDDIVKAANLPDGDYKIQICFNHYGYGDISPENAIIFASTSEANGNWNYNLIYDQDENCWYTGTKSFPINNQSWAEVKEKMEKNGWKPVEYTE
ncbi:prepilin-type N-terminal cleavage/methylation domain-containing protein [Holdemania massiliensis]|uniref:prepilin-type N-terminal cleavage/methylation domain-containing protein n=1 Tax=Holdemania massiliensis TaxID=1468449 RepID=UPI001F06D012|nr:prepilin-type N-terminal cleavage/methylation domain-containing protein [Holdemania massiliensis]MCH1942690.1 prepilin-type N-terminal cleavage/methylation domain-containing protein [Holdemania massiliensis]